MVHVHGGSRAGATMAPEGKDNIKGEACLGCKRNSLRPLTLMCSVLRPYAFQSADAGSPWSGSAHAMITWKREWAWRAVQRVADHARVSGRRAMDHSLCLRGR